MHKMIKAKGAMKTYKDGIKVFWQQIREAAPTVQAAQDSGILVHIIQLV